MVASSIATVTKSHSSSLRHSRYSNSRSNAERKATQQGKARWWWCWSSPSDRKRMMLVLWSWNKRMVGAMEGLVDGSKTERSWCALSIETEGKMSDQGDDDEGDDDGSVAWWSRWGRVFLPKTRELVECRMAHAGEEEGCVQRRKKMDDGLLSSQSRPTLTIK